MANDTARGAHVLAVHAAARNDCRACEPYALMVLGDSMAPEFSAGEVIVVEPGGLARDGSFVVAQVAGDWVLRRLVADGAHWRLAALDAGCPPVQIDDLSAVHGVVVQKRGLGRRRNVKRYVD